LLLLLLLLPFIIIDSIALLQLLLTVTSGWL
jgi:hypothetical protein